MDIFRETIEQADLEDVSLQILDTSASDVFHTSNVESVYAADHQHLTPEYLQSSSTVSANLTDISRSFEGAIDLEPLPLTNTSQWMSDGFKWSVELARTNRIVFGNRAFRHNQKEAINAHLSGKDVLVLMPTGVLERECGKKREKRREKKTERRRTDHLLIVHFDFQEEARVSAINSLRLSQMESPSSFPR